MINRLTVFVAAAAIALVGTAGFASAATGAPRGAHVFGTGADNSLGVAYYKAQQDARSKCASNQVTGRVSQTIVPLGGPWAVDLVLICG